MLSEQIKKKLFHQLDRLEKLEHYQKSKTKLCCECDFDSQVAYIVKSLNDIPTNTITIIEYLQNKILQEKVNKGNIYLVCEKGNELIKYQSDKKKSHFKHYNYSGNNKMSEWHKNWQDCFEVTEKEIGNRRADAVAGNNIIEFQHSRISTDNIDNRTKNYEDYQSDSATQYQVFWVIECDDAIKVEIINETYTLIFEQDMWKYKNFINQPFIYLDHNDKIFKINPQNIKSHMITVEQYKLKDEFINYVNGQNMIKWNDKSLDQGVIYHNQRGAGCGKTYESIQLLQKDNQFTHKEIFIYLTKMHSAKEVIFNELKEQRDRGDLDKLDFGEYDNNGIFGKQYKITFLNKETNKEIEIVIGTIDSFTYALGNKKTNCADYFKGIVNSIREGHVAATKDGTIKYAQKNVKLNQKCLVIIDEAQDLGPEYIEAFDMIVKKTGIDVYVIGDKLQSIWGEHNIYTYVEKNKLNTTVHKSIGKNEVKRFHNIQFKDFVNTMIDFKKYELSPIEDICNIENCKYKHENNKKPYKLFQLPEIYANDSDGIKVNTVIEQIIKYVECEITEYNYLPNNFMFIFPFLKDNYLANQLEARLQDYWIKKFDDKEYRKNVLLKNSYWKERIDTNKFRKYVYLHKSDENKPINLKESENATRMLSIHASKGNGCEVVFLLGVSEYTLVRFSKQKCNIVYDSLLHVAITRQKKSLYIGLINNGDEIWNRFNKNFGIIKDTNIKPRLENITKKTHFRDIDDYLLENNDMFQKINDTIIKPNNCEKKLSLTKANNNIIDWGHHVIRYCMFFYNVMKNIVENENMEENDEQKSQFETVLYKISNLKINHYTYKNYYNKLKDINQSNKTGKKITEIPILLFETSEKTVYRKYCNILKDFMDNIQNKLKKSLISKKLPTLCALETAILLHMIEIMDNGSYAKILIMDIYSIMYCYDECSNEINNNHPDECLCKTKFTEGNNSKNLESYTDIRKSIINHYEKTEQVKTIYINYKKYITDKYKSTKFTYNINQLVKFSNNTTNFRLCDNYQILAYSPDHVIHFIIKPQFNKLNFSEIMINAIFNNFVLNKCNDEKKRYQGKKIITCILSLDSNEPTFYEFDIDMICDDLFSYTQKYLIDKYITHHITLHEFYNYCSNNKPEEKNSLDYACDELDTYQTPYPRLPGYIIDYFHTVKRDVSKAKKKHEPFKNILARVSDKKLFLSEINDDLENTVNEYLGINESNEQDDDY